MPAQSLDLVLTPRRTGDTTFEFEVPPGWAQGKAVFGGLVLGGLVRAMTTAVDVRERRLRSLSAELVGSPVPGPAAITLRRLRATSSVTTLVAELSQAGEVVTHATGIFAAARTVPGSWTTLAPPSLPAFDTVEALPEELPFAPEFTQHFEYRPVTGLPFTGELAQPVTGWLRPRASARVQDEARLTALVDAWWLAVMAALETPRPAATLGFSVDFCLPPERIDPDTPLLHRGRTLHLHEGFSTETRELWTPAGELVTFNRQLVCVIK